MPPTPRAPGASRARFWLIWRSGHEREEARHEGGGGRTNQRTNQTNQAPIDVSSDVFRDVSPLLLWVVC